MNRKFTPPMKFFRLRKTDKNIRELMDWYEEKMAIMTRRQHSLSEKLTDVYAENKRLKGE